MKSHGGYHDHEVYTTHLIEYGAYSFIITEENGIHSVIIFHHLFDYVNSKYLNESGHGFMAILFNYLKDMMMAN